MANLTLTDDELLALAAFIDSAKRKLGTPSAPHTVKALAEVETAAMDILYSARAARRTTYRPVPLVTRDSIGTPGSEPTC